MTQINAVEQATEAMKGIPFVEFTATLVDEIFETLIDSHTKQVETFMQLFDGVSQGMEAYINNTTNDIDQEETLEFLKTLPGVMEAQDSDGILETLLKRGDQPEADSVDVAADVAKTIIDRIQIPGVTSDVVTQEALEADTLTVALPAYELFGAVAKRIAANRFSVLENMMRMGMMRLVLDKGIIETSIKIKTFERHKDVVRSSDKEKDRLKEKSKTKLKTGVLFRLFGKAKRKNKNTKKSIHISKNSEMSKDVSGSSIGIGAKVRLEFSTDHMSLEG